MPSIAVFRTTKCSHSTSTWSWLMKDWWGTTHFTRAVLLLCRGRLERSPVRATTWRWEAQNWRLKMALNLTAASTYALHHCFSSLLLVFSKTSKSTRSHYVCIPWIRQPYSQEPVLLFIQERSYWLLKTLKFPGGTPIWVNKVLCLCLEKMFLGLL